MRARKVDANHGQIIKALRQCGWRVLDTHEQESFVDCIAFKPALGLRLIEIKNGKGGRLTDAQERLIDEGWPVEILRSIDDAIALR